MRLRSALPLGLLAVSALALAAQAMDLKWMPKAGDKMTYKVAGSFEIPGAGEITLDGTRIEEVKSVEADKIVVTSLSKQKVNAMGTEIPVPDSTATTTYKPDGSVIALKVGDDTASGGMRMVRLTSFVFPAKAIAVGDAWTVKGDKDEKADLPGYSVEYKLAGEEKIGTWDTWKITSKGGEIEGSQPTKIEGTTWIEKGTGNLVKSTAQVTDALFSPQAPPLSGKLEVVRQP